MRRDSIVMWTEATRPWRMGGDVHQPVGVDVHVNTPIDVGYGISVYVVVVPDGRIAIVESQSGAIVGGSLKQVKQDIAKGAHNAMSRQIRRARKRREQVDVLNPDEFYSLWSAEHAEKHQPEGT